MTHLCSGAVWTLWVLCRGADGLLTALASGITLRVISSVISLVISTAPVLTEWDEPHTGRTAEGSGVWARTAPARWEVEGLWGRAVR